MSGFGVRRQPPVDDRLFVVRGGELTEAALRRDVIRARRRFGKCGVSVLAAVSEVALNDLAGGPLQRFQVRTVMTAGALRGSGLELRPRFRLPHHTVMLPDLDDDVSRLLQCQTELRTNVRHSPEEVQP